MIRRTMVLCMLATLVGALCLGQGTPARAQATVTTSRIVLPFNVTVTNPCNGELVQVSGTLTTVMQIVGSDPNSGNSVFQTLTHSDLSGVGLTTGVTYQVQMPDQSSFFVAQSGAPLVITETFDSHLIGQGTVPNFRMHTTAHITVDATGNLTSFVSEVTTDCTP